MRNGKKCLSELNEQYVLNQDRMQRHIKRLKSTTDDLENGIESDLSKRLSMISDLSQKLAKPLAKYSEIADDEFDVRVSTSEIIAECLKTLDKSMLRGSKVFDGNLIRKEDAPVIAPPLVEPSAQAIDQ